MPTHRMDACSEWFRSHLANDVQVLKCGLMESSMTIMLLLFFLLFFCSAGRC